jgi:hypothetical protein
MDGESDWRRTHSRARWTASPIGGEAVHMQDGWTARPIDRGGEPEAAAALDMYTGLETQAKVSWPQRGAEDGESQQLSQDEHCHVSRVYMWHVA